MVYPSFAALRLYGALHHVRRRGSAQAQLVGTDAVHSTLGQARGTAASAVGTARGTAAATANGAAGTAGALTGSTGNFAGSGQGAANGAASGGLGQLALAGSAASAASGAFAVEKGTPILAPDGQKIGKVRQVVADSRGQVQQLLVKVDGEKALLPASNFQANGDVLVSAMGEGTIKQIAEQQEEAE